MRSITILALVSCAALLSLTGAAADPSPTATATLLNTPTYGGDATIRVQIEGHVKWPAGVVWCSQWQGGQRLYRGYWEFHYPQYQRTMDVAQDYGPLMSGGGVDLEGWWNPALPASCSFIAFAESQGRNGKGPFALEGGWLTFEVMP